MILFTDARTMDFISFTPTELFTNLRHLRIKLFHLPSFPINIARNQNANNQKGVKQ